MKKGYLLFLAGVLFWAGLIQPAYAEEAMPVDTSQQPAVTETTEQTTEALETSKQTAPYHMYYVSSKEAKAIDGYYFKCVGQNVYISNNANGPFTRTPLPWKFLSNGAYAIYLDNKSQTLYQYEYETNVSTSLKKLSVKGQKYNYFELSAYYDGNVYLSYGGEDDWRYTTYVYQMSTKQFKQCRKDCDIWVFQGKYAIAHSDYRTDVSPGKVTLYQFTKNGLKKIKVLTKYGYSCAIIKNKVYYSSYPKGHMGKLVLYRCNMKGEGKKKLATVSSKEGEVIIQKITPTYCIYFTQEGTYKYTYKTKKKKKYNFNEN